MKLLIVLITLLQFIFSLKGSVIRPVSFLQTSVLSSFQTNFNSETDNNNFALTVDNGTVPNNQEKESFRESNAIGLKTNSRNLTAHTDEEPDLNQSSNASHVSNASHKNRSNGSGGAEETAGDEPGEFEDHINDTYRPGDAFINRTSQEFIDPHGGKFESVEYVRDLSPYAKEDIRDMNSPNKKDKALVGKPFYIENNITFDESPRIFHEIIETQVSKVETPITPISQYRLWKNWLGNKHFQDVTYDEVNKHSLSKPEEKKIEDMVSDSTKAQNNPNHIVIPPKKLKQKLAIKNSLDNLLKIRNPLKKQVYAMDYDTTFNRNENEAVSELDNISNDLVDDIETYDGKKKKKKRN